MTPSPWAMERAREHLSHSSLCTFLRGVSDTCSCRLAEREAVLALALDAARRDGAERMRGAAAQAADNQAWADAAGKTWRDSAKHVARHIRALNPARVLAGEGDDGTG